MKGLILTMCKCLYIDKFETNLDMGVQRQIQIFTPSHEANVRWRAPWVERGNSRVCCRLCVVFHSVLEIDVWDSRLYFYFTNVAFPTKKCISLTFLFNTQLYFTHNADGMSMWNSWSGRRRVCDITGIKKIEAFKSWLNVQTICRPILVRFASATTILLFIEMGKYEYDHTKHVPYPQHPTLPQNRTIWTIQVERFRKPSISVKIPHVKVNRCQDDNHTDVNGSPQQNSTIAKETKRERF